MSDSKIPAMLKKSGDKLELKDHSFMATADKDVLVKSAKCTVSVPAGHLVQTLSTSSKTVIVAVSPDTKVTFKPADGATDFKVLCDVSSDADDNDMKKPFELTGYDETKFERGQKFHYEGQQIRGEGETVVLKSDFLCGYMQTLLDDTDDCGELWDEPARVDLVKLISPLQALEDEIGKLHGEDRRAMRELVTYVKRRSAATLRLIEDLKSDWRVKFTSLDKVFGAGSRVSFRKDDVVFGGMVHKIRLEETWTSKWYSIQIRYIDYNGKNFGCNTVLIEVPAFGGTKSFKNMPLEPLIPDSPLYKMLQQRGEKFVRYAQGHQYLMYNG